VADDSERTADAAAGAVEVDEAAGLRARIAALEIELNKTRSEVDRLKREPRSERRSERRGGRSETQDRVEAIKEIVDRVDGEGRRAFRALVLSQMEHMRLTADLISSFATRIERDNPPDDPDLERDLPSDLVDGWLDTVDRALDIPEKTIETFEETYKQAPRTRRTGRADRAV
jgi:hypothetical protein